MNFCVSQIYSNSSSYRVPLLSSWSPEIFLYKLLYPASTCQTPVVPICTAQTDWRGLSASQWSCEGSHQRCVPWANLLARPPAVKSTVSETHPSWPDDNDSSMHYSSNLHFNHEYEEKFAVQSPHLTRSPVRVSHSLSRVAETAQRRSMKKDGFIINNNDYRWLTFIVADRDLGQWRNGMKVLVEYRKYSFSGLGAKRPPTPATIGGPAHTRGPALDISLKLSVPPLDK